MESLREKGGNLETGGIGWGRGQEKPGPWIVKLPYSSASINSDIQLAFSGDTISKDGGLCFTESSRRRSARFCWGRGEFFCVFGCGRKEGRKETEREVFGWRRRGVVESLESRYYCCFHAHTIWAFKA